MLNRKHAACNFTYIDLHIGTEREVCLMRDIEIYLLSHHLFVSYWLISAIHFCTSHRTYLDFGCSRCTKSTILLLWTRLMSLSPTIGKPWCTYQHHQIDVRTTSPLASCSQGGGTAWTIQVILREPWAAGACPESVSMLQDWSHIICMCISYIYSYIYIYKELCLCL